jgi:hypothetical protein
MLTTIPHRHYRLDPAIQSLEKRMKTQHLNPPHWITGSSPLLSGDDD